MKNLILSFITIFFVASCSQSNSEEPSVPVIEYVWHSAGPDFNSKNLAKLIIEWNDIITSSSMEMNGANILTPQVANDGYDFIWVMRWPSMAARDAGWDWWTNNASTGWDKSIDGIMSFDPVNAYAFEVSNMSSPKIENNTGSFSNRFHFCAYNEGFGNESLESFKDAVDSNLWTDTYWNVLLNPTFNPDPKPDFVWLDLWADDTDKEIALRKFMDSEYANMYLEMFTCNTADFNGTVIR